TRDRQEPGRECRARLEAVSLSPHAQEHVAGQILRGRGIADQPQYEAIDPGVVAREQDLHRQAVAGGDLADQRLVRVVVPGRARALPLSCRPPPLLRSRRRRPPAGAAPPSRPYRAGGSSAPRSQRRRPRQKPQKKTSQTSTAPPATARRPRFRRRRTSEPAV